MLQTVEQGPPGHIRQTNIEGDGVRGQIEGEAQSPVPTSGDHGLESVVVSQIEEDAREGEVVLDDQQHLDRRGRWSRGRRAVRLWRRTREREIRGFGSRGPRRRQ